jgi:acetyl esterase/lipase
VLDVVRAARRVDPRIGRRVAIMGHSQGGHAALWAAALARSYTPELQVRGTVAYAPASHIAEQAGALDLLTSPSSLSAFAAMILRGAELVQPSLRVRELLTEQAAALYPSVDERCFGELAQPSSYGGLAPAAVVRPGADRTAALAVIAPSDPEDLTIRTPVWIGQGTADATVLPPFTDQLEAKLRARGTPVTSRRWEGVDHDRIVRRGQAAARSFLRRRVGR